MTALRVFLLTAMCLGAAVAEEAPGDQVDIIFSNESYQRADVYWLFKGTHEEKLVKSLKVGEKYAERTFPDQKFHVKFNGKLGEAFFTGKEKRQYRVILGRANEMARTDL